jgi:hypothetical protein
MTNLLGVMLLFASKSSVSAATPTRRVKMPSNQQPAYALLPFPSILTALFYAL